MADPSHIVGVGVRQACLVVVLTLGPACHLLFPFDPPADGVVDAAPAVDGPARVEGGLLLDAAPLDLPQWLDAISPQHDFACTDWGTVCPSQCTNGCACGVCKLDCASGCTCPQGWSCEAYCSAESPCNGPVDCSQGLDCKIRCSVQQCNEGLVSCGTGYCDVFCDHGACGGGIDCNSACACKVGCFATGATCKGTIQCLPGCASSVVKGCIASGSCNQC